MNKSDITTDVTDPQLDDEQVTQSELDSSVTMSAVSTASPQFVPSSGNDFMQNMSSLSGMCYHLVNNNNSKYVVCCAFNLLVHGQI